MEIAEGQALTRPGSHGIIGFLADSMKNRLSTVVTLLVLATASAQTLPAGQQGTPPTSPATQAAAQADEAARRAEIYYDVIMGHLFAQDYVASNKAEHAGSAIEFYKKAYALDPTSQVIGEQLAEMYFLSQRIGDAVNEARDILSRDPNNLSVRRLLVRIYIRSLGELRDSAAQSDAVKGAVEQLNEIVRQDPSDTESALWLARLDRLSNRQDQAEQVLRDLLARDPENEMAVDQLTQLLVDENKSDEAIALLEKELAGMPNATLYDRLGDAYTQKQDSGRAEQAYRHAVDLDPEHADHLQGLGQSLSDQGKFQEAAGVYEKLAVIEPNDVSNRLRLSETYRHLHQMDKAEQQVLLAKQHAPGNLEVIYDEAAVYEAEARYEDAVHVLSDAVAEVKGQSEFTPARRRTLAILYQLLGQMYRDEQNYTPAINTLEEMARLGPEEDHRARLLIIDAYRANHDLPQALEAARKGIADYPQDRGFKISEALLLGDNSQPDQAAQVLRPLLDNSTDDLEIDLDLTQVYAQNRRFSDAEASAHAAEKLAQQPGDHETIGFLLADVYARQKKYDQAEQVFQGVLAINPRNSSVLNYYGYLLADRGVRLQEAAGFIGRALAEDPNNAAYLDSLGWTYYKQDKLADAEAYLRKAMIHDEHDPTMHSHLGDILAKGGHSELAEAEWERAIVEWHRALPAEFEAAKVTELEQKISNLKDRLAQQKIPGNAGAQ